MKIFKKGIFYNMDTLVITTVSNWYEVPRIRHQLAKQMSRFYNVLYIETPTQWRHWHNTKIEKVEKNITRCRLSNHFILPEKIYRYFPFLKNYYEKFTIKKILQIISIYDKSNIILINFNHNFLQIMKEDIFKLKIYLCNDDFPSMIKNEKIRKKILARESKVAKYADLCLGVSYYLVDRLKKYNINSFLFLPGHNFKISKNSFFIKKEDRKSINVGFMGFISDRIKFDWLLYAAKKKDIYIHLIGPIINENKIRRYIQTNLVNIYKPIYDNYKLQSFLEKMDVLTIPYSYPRPEAITAPNKLFSYIASGKPIVSYGFPNLVTFKKGIIYFADSKESFVRQINKAYREDNNELIKKRYEIAKKNTWDVRGNELKAMIDKNIKKLL